MGCSCYYICQKEKKGASISKQQPKVNKINSTMNNNNNIKPETNINYQLNQDNKNNDENKFSSKNDLQIKEIKSYDANISYPDLDEKPKYPDPILKPIKKREPKKDYILKVEKFMEENEIQDDFYEKNDEENDDKLYLELKSDEKKELKKIFDNLKKNYGKNIFQKEKLNLTLDKKLISSFIEIENSKQIIRKKIIKEIEIIENDKEKYKIDHLTTLVVGKGGIDKKSLIKYMLKLDSLEMNNSEKKDFVVFESKKVPYLRLIKYRPIGYGDNDSAEVITKETVEYIKKQSKENTYNNFVHCIWYCCKGNRLEDLEIEYLKQLRMAYLEVQIPVILINLNNIEKESIEKWKKAIQKEIDNKVLDVDYLTIITKRITEDFTKIIHEPEGEEKLLNLTLNKCNAALQGEMQKIMMKNISNDIETTMEDKIEESIHEIKETIQKEFVNEFKKVKNDNELINYILSILGRNLKIFYGKKISNKSLNIIFNSEIINNTINFIKFYKKNVKKIISKEIVIKAKEFLDLQAYLEKKNNENIKIKNKRTLNGFIKTNEIFLKKNFYYILQKYIIYIFIKFFCNDYFETFQKNLISLANNLINSEKDSDISIYIQDCFSSKLKRFGEKMNFDFKFDNYIKPQNDSLIGKNNGSNKDEQLLTYDIDDSLNYDINDDEEIIKDNEDIVEIGNEINIFENYELKGDWKYLTEVLINNLNIFMQKIIYQDKYFNLSRFNLINTPLNFLKNYEENKLKSFFNNNIITFIGNVLDKFINNYKNIIENMDKVIKNIFVNEKLSSIIARKIEKEFERMKNDTNICKIGYFTILICGKTGVGKSTLINALLKENLAEEGDDIHIKTIIPHKYANKKVPFLNLIDTRGIELDKINGVQEILKVIQKIIEDPSQLYYNSPENPLLNNNKELTYNDQIQCVWYCVRNKYLDEEEKKFINELIKKNGQNKLPIIIVFTHSTIKEDANSIENQVKIEFPNIPFVRTRARVEENKTSYGLDELIEKTIELCKGANQGRIFKEIKQKLNHQMINVFQNKNSEIKNNANNEIIKTFIKEFDKVLLNQEEFKNYIFKLFKIIFIGYLKLNLGLNNNIKNFTEKSYNNFFESNLSKYIVDFFQYYQIISTEIINTTKEEKAIEFLNEQVKNEKKCNKNIEANDKCTKNGFIDIIKNFLEYNFYYTAQKIFIYRVLVDCMEKFSEKVEIKVNSEIEHILNTHQDIHHWFEDIYKKKIENLEETINKFYKKNGYNYDYEPPVMINKEDEQYLKEENDKIIINENINKKTEYDIVTIKNDDCIDCIIF